MRLLSFAATGRESWGAVVGDAVADLGKILPGCPTLADFLASADYARREEIIASVKPEPRLSEVQFLPVILRPEKIVCTVRNYLDHHNEAIAFGTKRELTQYPPIFLKSGDVVEVETETIGLLRNRVIDE